MRTKGSEEQTASIFRFVVGINNEDVVSFPSQYTNRIKTEMSKYIAVKKPQILQNEISRLNKIASSNKMI